jgi:hypothetical protein
VVVVSAGSGVEESDVPGSDRNVSDRAALKATASDPPSARSPVTVTEVASPPESGRSPGEEGGEVINPVGVTRRPPGGAKVIGAPACGVAETAAAGTGSDPGRPIRKPIVEPAKTASSSQRTARRGTQ